MNASLLVASMLAALFLAPAAAADSGSESCADTPLPDDGPCVSTEVCLALLGGGGCFDATDPKSVVGWVRGVLGG